MRRYIKAFDVDVVEVCIGHLLPYLCLQLSPILRQILQLVLVVGRHFSFVQFAAGLDTADCQRGH